MLAQAKDWSNARQGEFKQDKTVLGFRESRSDGREKIPGLVPATVEKIFMGHALVS
jgi:hypothetical protein